MAFEKLAPYLEQIEEGFRNKQSPRAVAAAIGQPSLYSTIDRYKRAIWNFNDLVSEAKEVRAVKHEEAREAMVQEIVDTLDTLNLAKFRARQLLRLELGDEYTLADGSIRKVSWQTAANLWQVGQRMICDVNKVPFSATPFRRLSHTSWKWPRLPKGVLMRMCRPWETASMGLMDL